ncbi:MAG: hypothetical protein ACM3JC_10585 [Rudaea sp.]
MTPPNAFGMIAAHHGKPPANPVEHIGRWSDDFTKIRRDLQVHPELGFEEHRTARLFTSRSIP